ncbi:hypothetical protein ACQB60_07190 [Actinomycetota bacterium Odt1-20B]
MSRDDPRAKTIELMTFAIYTIVLLGGPVLISLGEKKNLIVLGYIGGAWALFVFAEDRHFKAKAKRKSKERERSPQKYDRHSSHTPEEAARRRSAGVLSLSGYAFQICSVAMLAGYLTAIILRVDAPTIYFDLFIAFVCGAVFNLGSRLHRKAFERSSDIRALQQSYGLTPGRLEDLPVKSHLEEESSLARSSRKQFLFYLPVSLLFILFPVGLIYSELRRGNPHLVIVGANLVSLAVGVHLLTRSQRFMRAYMGAVQPLLDPAKPLATGSYSLLLRPFVEDRKMSKPSPIPSLFSTLFGYINIGQSDFGASEEKKMAGAFSWTGPLVAVGAPGEKLPPLGAVRTYMPSSHWKVPVRKLMIEARVVFLILGKGNGTMWELREAWKILPPERLVLLVPMNRTEYNSFRSKFGRDFSLPESQPETGKALDRKARGSESRRPPMLPEYKDGSSVRLFRKIFFNVRCQGVVYFNSAWEPTFVPLPYMFGYQHKLARSLDKAMLPAARQIFEREVQRT